MKFNTIAKILLAGGAISLLASCHNKEQVFPDYDGGITTYFAYQYPVRTIVLGESETFDTSLDNEGKCIIYGTMGGAYKGKDIVVDIEVDNTLTDNLFYDAEGKNPVKAMPAGYYSLSGNQLKYDGNHMGGVEVQLTDAFFADPDAVKTTYVIPVKMTNIVKGADQILAGVPAVEGEPAWRTDASQWKTLPKDYTLYAVKYINPWDGSWLRRGVDTITEGGQTTTDVRHKQYVENDEVMFLTTQSLKSVSFPMTTNVTMVVPPPVEYAMSVQSNGKGESYGAQLVYTFASPLKAGTTYTLTCMTKASGADYESGIFLQNADSKQQYGVANVPFTSEWKKVSVDFTPNADNPDYNQFMFNCGNYEGTLLIDRVSFVEKGKTDELAVNGDFTDGKSEGWNCWGGNMTAWGTVAEGYTETEPQPSIEIVPVATDLVLTFAEDGTCTVSSATEGVTATGTGKYVKDGEKLAWGNKDRDGIYLDYTVDFGSKQYAIKDTLVSRSREVTAEFYAPTFKK